VLVMTDLDILQYCPLAVLGCKMNLCWSGDIVTAATHLAY